MSTVVIDNIIYKKISSYSAVVGRGGTEQHTAIYDLKQVQSKVNIEESVVINGKKLVVTELAYGSFGNMSGISHIVIPNTIEVINSYSFWLCSSLENITFLPGSRLKKFGLYVLDGVKIKELKLPSTLSTISKYFVHNVYYHMKFTYISNNIIKH